MGKGGGGGDGGAAAARAEEAARKARISGNIDAVKRQFFASEDAQIVPDPILGDVPYRRRTGYDNELGEQTFEDSFRPGNINQAEIDSAIAFNKNRPLTDDPTAARVASFADIEKRVRDRFVPDFDQDIGDARRELKFALSRRNLLGSSGQVDAEGRLDDRIAQGQRAISERVSGARSSKEAFDENLLNNLVGQAQADISRSSLLSGLGANLLSNSNRAVTGANQQVLGNMFGDVGTLFKEINDQRAINAGLANAGLFRQQSGTNPTSIFKTNTGSPNQGTITDF